jgi:hypothetical protein
MQMLLDDEERMHDNDACFICCSTFLSGNLYSKGLCSIIGLFSGRVSLE